MTQVHADDIILGAGRRRCPHAGTHSLLSLRFSGTEAAKAGCPVSQARAGTRDLPRGEARRVKRIAASGTRATCP
jgi:hypothetical protein